MNRVKFIELLEQAKTDEYDNLYYIKEIGKDDPVDEEGENTHRVYFGTITTICENLMELVSNPLEHELYDRHFWNDDTLQCKIVNVQ